MWLILRLSAAMDGTSDPMDLFFAAVEEVSVTAPSDINVLVPAWEAFQALIA